MSDFEMLMVVFTVLGIVVSLIIAFLTQKSNRPAQGTGYFFVTIF